MRKAITKNGLTEGARVTFICHGKRIENAKIHHEKGVVYLCSNSLNGCSCENKLGYKYSYHIGNGSERAQTSEGVNNLEEISETEFNRMNVKRRKTRELIKKMREKTIGKEKSPNYKIVDTIYDKLFNIALRKLDGHATACLLGRDKKYIIRQSIVMQDNGGCYAMPSISAGELSRAMLTIVKKNLIPCGIARCGTFRNGYDERGTIISQLRNLSDKAILLSFSGRSEQATLEMPSIYKNRKLTFYVVPNKK